MYDGNFFQDIAVVIDIIFPWVGVTLSSYLEDNKICSNALVRFFRRNELCFAGLFHAKF